MIRILHVLPSLDGGGIENLLYNYCIRMPEDIHFDFAICNADKTGMLEPPLLEHGCGIYRFPRLHDGFLKSVSSLKRIIKNGKYDIVQVHTAHNSFPAILASRLGGAKIRIAHSHAANLPEGRLSKLKRKFFVMLAKLFATDLFACGRDAGRWCWGENSGFYIMHNAIETEKFRFNESKRDELRRQFDLEGKFVIGNVSRFSPEKNHEFIIDIFAECAKSRGDAVLVLIGRGDTQASIREKVDRLGLSDRVLFLGVRNDVPDLLNMLDLFLLPSRYEGLPVTLVEVQSNGLPACVSDSVTGEIKISKNVKYLALSAPAREWVDSFPAAERSDARAACDTVAAAGYDIDREATVIAEKYRCMIKERR